MSRKYILEDKVPKPIDDVMEWGRWFETADRHVGLDTIDGARISTVFLGLDHNWSDDGPPILFETMIFGGEHNDYCERCCTWEEAEAQHKRAMDLVSATSSSLDLSERGKKK